MSEQLEHGHACPYCLCEYSFPMPNGVRRCNCCERLYCWSPTTFLEKQGRAAIAELRRRDGGS